MKLPKLPPKKYLIPAIILVVVVVGIMLRKNGNEPAEEEKQIVKHVTVQSIELQNEVVTDLTVSGTTIPKQYSVIRSLTPGTIEYLVAVGTQVTQGEPLFRIRDANIESSYFNSLQNYQQTQIITQQQVDQSQLALSSAEARLNLAKSSYETAKRQADQATVTARNTAINSYTSAYSLMDQALNFMSEGTLGTFDAYRYKNVERAPVQTRINTEAQFLIAVEAFMPLAASPDTTNLEGSLDEGLTAMYEVKRLVDMTVALLQAATTLDADPTLVSERTQMLSYQTQLNQSNTSLISADNTLIGTATNNQLALDQAENQLNLAEIEFDNATIAEKNAQQSAGLQTTGAQTQLDANAYNYNNLTLRSPFSGTVLSHFVNAGEQVSIGQELIEVGNLSLIEIPVEVDVDFARGLQLGQEALIEGDVAGVVTEIEPAGNIRSGKVGVVVQTQDPENQLAAGAVADVTLEIRYQEEDLIVIPIKAATIESTETTVLVVEDGKAAKRTVVLGQVFGNRVSVLKGLEAEDQVIIPNGVFVSAGDMVTVE